MSSGATGRPMPQSPAMDFDIWVNLDPWRVGCWIDAVSDGTFRGRMAVGQLAGEVWEPAATEFVFEPNFTERTIAIAVMVAKACEIYG